jgi:hypothetical protein
MGKRRRKESRKGTQGKGEKGRRKEFDAANFVVEEGSEGKRREEKGRYSKSARSKSECSNGTK